QPDRTSGKAGSSATRRVGRLYRLSWSGGPAHPELPLRSQTSWSAIASLGGSELIKKLAASEAGDARIAQQELIPRGPINKAAIHSMLPDREAPSDAKILAAGALCSWWDDDVKNAMIKLATDDDTILRRIAAECLGRYSPRRDPLVQQTLLYILGDPDPAT